MNQQCWRPPSPTAAGLPSGWRCRPAGPVWSSTSGCCWALCAAVSLNPGLAARASNAARRRPVTSPSASDTLCDGAGQEGGGRERPRDSEPPRGAPQESFGSGVRDSQRCEMDQSGGSVLIKTWCHRLDSNEPLTRTWLWFGNTFTVWIAKGIRGGETLTPCNVGTTVTL